MAFGNAGQARYAQEQGDQGREDAFMYEVWPVYPNEAFLVRFYGGPDEPYIFSQHGFSKTLNGGFDREICSKSTNSTCDACAAAAKRGEKRVKAASPVGAFSIFSSRIVLSLPQQKPDGSMGVKRECIHVDSEGMHIEKVTTGEGYNKTTSYRRYPGGMHPAWPQVQAGQIKWEFEGPRIWRGSMHTKARNASEIVALDARLSKRCKCGAVVGDGIAKGPASILVDNYSCSNCNAKVAYNEEHRNSNTPVVCPNCRATMIPNETLRCSAGCGNPVRGSLTDCYVQVKREGAGGLDTVYIFEPMPFSAVDPSHQEAMFPIDEKTGVRSLYPNFPFREIYKAKPESIKQALMERGILIGQVAGPGMQGQFPAGFGQPNQGGFSPTNPFAPQTPMMPPGMPGMPPSSPFQGGMPSLQMGQHVPAHPPQMPSVPGPVPSSPVAPPGAPPAPPALKFS